MGFKNIAPRLQHTPNEHKINTFFNEVKELSSKHKMSIAEVIECFKVLELQRKNDLFLANGDLHDFQMSEVNELLEQAIESLRMIADKA
jgi:hypothetical protein